MFLETVKAHVTNKSSPQKEYIEMSLVSRFQKMEAERTEYLKAVGIPAKHALDGVTITHVRQNQGLDIWFWCQTENALSKLKNADENTLLEVVYRFCLELMPELSDPFEPRNIDMDWRALASDKKFG